MAPLSSLRAPEPESRRTHQLIRRNSFLAGKCEARFWRPFERGSIKRLLLAAERYELANRQPGRRMGPLGDMGLVVLRELTRMVDFRSGRLDPAIATIARRIKRAPSAVKRALARLRAHGFVDWLRRFKVAEGWGQRGPQVEQTSNAYAITLPAKAERLLHAEAPVPDDFEAAKAQRAAELRAMLQEERRDGPLGRLCDAIERRKWGMSASPLRG